MSQNRIIDAVIMIVMIVLMIIVIIMIILNISVIFSLMIVINWKMMHTVFYLENKKTLVCLTQNMLNQ